MVTGQEHPEEPVPVFLEKPRRLAEADTTGDTHELRSVHDAGDTDVYRQLHAPLPDATDPMRGHRGVEADLADDVGGVGRLVIHRLDGCLVADQGMALRVPRDADLLEGVPDLGHRFEERGRALELAGGLGGVPGDDERVLYAGPVQPPQHALQVRLVANKPRRDVRRHLVAPSRQPLGEPHRLFDTLFRRRRHRELDALGHVLDDSLLHASQGYHLVPGASQGLGYRVPHLLFLIGHTYDPDLSAVSKAWVLSS